jgi:DNA processing protein
MNARDGAGEAATGHPLPTEAYLCALASLSAMGPSRLRKLVRAHGAAGAWDVVRGAVHPPAQQELALPGVPKVRAQWIGEARAIDPSALWQRHLDAGVGVAMLGSPSMPLVLADDIDPPVVLFHAGHLDALDGPRVAIVGTRRATRYGIDVADELGHDLAAAGVRVVSGLAGGIDGAAHWGALRAAAAPPIGVVGSGLDVAYPPRNRDLWADVVAAGLLLTEHPLGMGPARWHFPARNRLVAALADVVVVIESRVRGGSLYTVDEAIRRDRPVLAVPGSVRSPASAGTNALLHAGCGPCRDAEDVLVLLGLRGAGRPHTSRGVALDLDLTRVLEALEWQPVTFDQLQARTGLSVGELAVAMTRLEADGWVEQRQGFYERRASA